MLVKQAKEKRHLSKNSQKRKCLETLKKCTELQKYHFLHKKKKNISCFQKNVDFKYPQIIDEFNMHLTFFPRRGHVDNNIDIVMGKNNVFDKLIAMDSISGLADKSDDFANFLTISRKFSFNCVYVFHTMYPTRSTWQMILSHTKDFNIFPGYCRWPLLSKFYLLTVTDTPTNTNHTGTFG